MKRILQALAALLAVAILAIFLLLGSLDGYQQQVARLAMDIARLAPNPAAGMGLDLADAMLEEDGLQGKLSISFRPAASMEADLRLDQLRLASSDALLLPLDLLRKYEVKLLVRIAALQLGPWQLHDVKLEVAGNRETVTTLVAANGLGGQLVASIATDLDGAGSSQAVFTADEVKADEFTGIAGLQGRLQVNSELRFTGGRLGELAASIAGKSSFSIQDGRLDVTPIKRMSLAIDTVRGKRSSVSDWPDALPFQLLTGLHHFGGGAATGQAFHAELEHLAITGQGGFDLAANRLDYEITTVFNAQGEAPFTVPQQLIGARWPIRCWGLMATAPLDLCFGEDARIATTVKHLTQRQAREPL